VLFQIGPVPDTMISGGTRPGLGVGYLIARMFNIIANYMQIPLINLSFIFLLAPFISLLYLYFRLRKEGKEKFNKKLADLSFEYKKSPKEMIIEKLTKGGLKNERRLFRSLVVLLPISLYLLVTILNIAGVDALDPNHGGLGWFLEIFFVYIATFLYAIHLIKSSKASYEGKFVGEKLENDTYTSLMSVATPISVLSILLFVVEAFQTTSTPQEAIQSLILVIYFFGYFIMAAFIFVTMIAIFEPISILLFIKIINGVKSKEKSRQSKENLAKNIGVSAMFGVVSVLMIFLLSVFLGMGQGLFDSDPNLNLLGQNTFFIDALKMEGTSAVSTLGTIIIVVATGIVIGYSYKQNKNLFINSITIFVLLLAEAILLQFLTSPPIFPFFGDSGSTYWVTGQLVQTNVFGPQVFTLRTALVEILFGNENLILYALSVPFQYLRYFMSLFLIGLTFHYIRQDFITKTVKSEGYVDQITFARIDILPTYEQCLESNFLLSIPKSYRPSENERDEVKRLMYECRNGITLTDLLPDDVGERDRMYVTIKYMTKRKHLLWWEPEFSFTNERAELDSMYTMYDDGRDVFSYKFKESSTADPGLVAGMFSAITSFIKETTKSADLLRTIDHGDTKVIIEYGKHVFGAIFADRETVEIRSKLATFVAEFERRHEDVLKKWDGNCTPFANDEVLLKEIFEL
jgi:competence protein ComGC